MKKPVAILLIAVMLLISSATSYAAGYTDVKSTNWAYPAVNAMSEKAVISGYPDGSFLPNNTVTYGEFIKMALIGATGDDVGNSSTGNWAAEYYNKAKELGYYTDYDINKNKLTKQITRAHMALIISSILGDVKIDKYDEIQEGITDITCKTPYEYDIMKAYAAGILTGYTDKTFKPEKTLTRAEAATVIHRLVDESKRVLPGEAGTGTAEGGNSGEQKTPIDQIITNLDTFRNPGDGSLNEYLMEAQTYEIVKDGDKYGMTLRENRGTKWIEIPPAATEVLGQIYLMKGGQIVEWTMRSPQENKEGLIYSVAGYDSDISQIDYIVSLFPTENHALLIANPFKNQSGTI